MLWELLCSQLVILVVAVVLVFVSVIADLKQLQKDIMGTIGHNVMVWAEDGANAIWFMIGSHDREKVREFWAQNGGSIDDDNYFMPVEVRVYIYIYCVFLHLFFFVIFISLFYVLYFCPQLYLFIFFT